jgi:phospholipid/cholesterol/gamma-HCH transport system ATP-binding protein
MIEIRNLTKSFGSSVVWKDVNMTIDKGETLAIIGRSGCGKSVLVKHINALMKPDAGEVLIDGRNIFDLDYVGLRKIRQKFGILFQGAALFDSITTFENVAFPLRYFTDQSEEEIRHNVLEALSMVRLENVAEKSTAELSGGMRKRVGLARAVVLKPEYLIYDEPTSGLDPQTSDEINDLITTLSDQLSITTIVVTHDMHSVLRVADRVAFLHDRRLHWLGTVEQMRRSDDQALLSFIKASEYQIQSEGSSL